MDLDVVLTREEAFTLVNESLVNTSTDQYQVTNLVETLHFFPLALQQALAFIRIELNKSQDDPIVKYLELFAVESEKCNQFIKICKTNTEFSINENNIITTCLLTFNILKDKEYGSLAIRIMKLASLCDPDSSIPAKIFLKLKISWFSSIISNSDVDGAIALLKKYSLVSGEVGEINIHRYVQNAVRLTIEQDTQFVLNEALQLLKQYFRPAEAKLDNFVKSLLPHATSIWRHSLKHKTLVQCYAFFPSCVCDKLLYYGNYSSTLKLASDSKSDMETVFRKNVFHKIYLSYHEARAFYGLNNYAQSLEILNEIHPVSKRNFGECHQLTLLIWNLIAMNFEKQGKHEQELEIYEEILATRLKKWGPEHKDTLVTLHNTGNALKYLGRLDEALGMFQSVYAVQKRLLLGQEDDFSLKTKDLIAEVLLRQGNWKEALVIFKEVYEARKTLLGADHPQTLASQEIMNTYKQKFNL